MATAAAFAIANPSVCLVRHSGSERRISTSFSKAVSFAGARDVILGACPLKIRRKGNQSGNYGTFSVRASARSSRDVHLQETGYVPQSDFYKVEAVVRPWRLSHVASALIKMGIRGVTVYDVRGFGSQGGARERYAGSEFTEDSFVQKVKLEIVVSQDQVEAVISTIIDHARTGEIGDGKVFISPVSDVVRVRTGERGLKAERMAGGRAEILGVVEN